MTAGAPDAALFRASLLLASDPAAAARAAAAVLQRSPDHADAQLLMAAACRKLGDHARAIAVLEELTQATTASGLMHLELGRAYAGGGRTADAQRALRRAVELDPAMAVAWRELAAQCFDGGNDEAGDSAYARYTALTPDAADHAEIAAALADDRLRTAEQLLQRRLNANPNDVDALRLCAEIAARQDDFREAERLLLRCLRLAPGYAAARFDLARVYHLQQQGTDALSHLERLLALHPRDAAYLSLKAQALRLIGRSEEAIALTEQLCSADPLNEQHWILRGHLLREIGRQSEAVAMYRRALAVRPTSGAAYWNLANLKTVRLTPEDLTAMQEHAHRRVASASDRVQLEFALGKALEDEGRFAEAFAHYSEGNALHRRTFDYDADAVTADVERSMRMYSAEFFGARAGSGSVRQDPIFIVGLPRSGSTLLEQIMGSHSQVEITRELLDLPAITLDIMSTVDVARRRTYPEPVATLSRQAFDDLAARYLSRTQSHRVGGKSRFTDKMLANFAHVGLIHLLFPNAAIIDIRRHPLANGFSCYKQYFAQGMKYAYDLTELGRYYRDYAALMDHMDGVLPGRVYRVHYEHLVADPEGEVRRLLDHCGLPFEERCLKYYENARVVQTISSEQVRKPIYSDSVEQWSHFREGLQPLTTVLGDLVARYPA